MINLTVNRSSYKRSYQIYCERRVSLCVLKAKYWRAKYFKQSLEATKSKVLNSISQMAIIIKTKILVTQKKVTLAYFDYSV
jgi:hypothetical protein